MSDTGTTLAASVLDSHMEREIERLTDLLDRVRSLNEVLDAISAETVPTGRGAGAPAQTETKR